jgi:conjugative transposon TraN protein
MLTFIISCCIGSMAVAQDNPMPKDTLVRYLPNSVAVNENNIQQFNISLNATTHIISPEPILYADISTPEVEGDIQEKNIVRIKPASTAITANESFTITIVTRVFVAVYKLTVVNPVKAVSDSTATTYAIAIDPTKTIQLNQSNALSQPQCYELSMQALAKKRRLKHLHTKAYGMSVWMNNIYIVGDYLLFDIGVKNKSKLPFDLDELRFKIKDRFTVNASISQELELQPVFQLYGHANTVIEGSWRNFYIFKKFTFPTQKIFTLQLTEQQISGRKVELMIDYNKVLHARFLL